MKNFQINPRLFALLALSFVLATIVGTVSHELGHFAVAKYYKGHPKLHYASVSQDEPSDFATELSQRYNREKNKIESPNPSPEKKAYMAYREEIGEKLKHATLFILLGGPLQTMLTGSLGGLMLWRRRKKIATLGMRAADWFWVILAFFWSRQLANFLVVLKISFIRHRISGGDETRISRYFGWHTLTFNTITGIAAATVLLWVVFIIIPKTQRLNFILAGLCGSALGWLVWMEWMGPVLLP